MWEDDDDLLEELERMNNEPFVMVRHKSLCVPAPLAKGDKIGIVSFSGYESEEVIGAMGIIASHGYVPVVSKAIQRSHPESGIIPRGERISELHYILEDPEISAIFCCGDGSGSIEMLPNFSYGPIARNAKWLVGNGDVTAMLAMWLISDIASVHGPMCAEMTPESQGVASLFNLLASGGKMDYLLPVSSGCAKGEASGILIGGNLSVLTLLGGTSYDMINRYTDRDFNANSMILFVEDSGVSLRRVRDMLLRLYLTGRMLFVKGLIFGSFDDCEPYEHLQSIRDVVQELEDRWMISPGIPIVFDFPIGKGTENIPLLQGQEVRLEVSDELVSFRSVQSEKNI